MRFTHLFSVLMATGVMTQTIPLRLVSFNIRYAATGTALQTNEKPWEDRAPLVINQLKDTISKAPSNSRTVIGLQEVLHSQLVDIGNGLGSAWSYIGVGRDDGKEKGEYNPIFYRPSVEKLVYNVTKWLSPTPDVPSYGWNAGSRRMVNVGVFQDVATGKRFIVANTHLDQVSLEARTKGIQVALNVIQNVQNTYGPLSVSLTGDFNSEPTGQDAYSSMVTAGFKDVEATATASQRFGEYNTSTGFDPAKIVQNSKRIDFIWLGPKSYTKWQVARYEVVTNVKNNIFMSDHRTVVGDVTFVSW